MRYIILYLSVFLILSSTLTLGSINQSNIIYVDDDNTSGPWDGSIEHPYQHLQDAIDNASSGDTIFVKNGVYNESLSIYKTVFLVGDSRELTILEGGYRSRGMNIKVDGIAIENFTIKNLTEIGIISDKNDVSIKNCTIYRTHIGVKLEGEDIIVDNCLFYTNGKGILISNSSKIFIDNSIFCCNGIGIDTINSREIKFYNCSAHTNGIGFFFYNSSDNYIDHCALYNNNDNQGGIFLQYCNNIKINDSFLKHNGFGVRIENSSFIDIIYSNLTWNTHTAIMADGSHDINISSCEITRNLRFSFMSDRSITSFYKNNIHSSLFAFYLIDSTCNARYNWWGSLLGPSLLEYKNRDRIRYSHSKIHVYPWSFTPNIDAGVKWHLIEQPIIQTPLNNIKFKEIDSDNDGVPNWWEEKWGYNPYIWDDHRHLDPDNDGLNNIEECYTDSYNSNPFHKDLFLEIDWMTPYDRNHPPESSIDALKKVFADHNIALHVDIGNLGGGEEIPYLPIFTYSQLVDLYWKYFLHNNLNNPRRGIFHYCIICNRGPGPGFAFIGWYGLDSFLISADMLQENQPRYSREHLVIHGILHEMGHNLGLTVDDYGGNDNKIATWPITKQYWLYRNYKSVMNYWYTYKLFDYSDGTHGRGDFSDWQHIDLAFFKHTNFLIPPSSL
ncbi:MAG: hypothetical protein DRN12_01430 [Thermoplasmata archaeon]|nr:MAG: hypothetical protein DRN12_01430 [Thermoplasmata archaeon]